MQQGASLRGQLPSAALAHNEIIEQNNVNEAEIVEQNDVNEADSGPELGASWRLANA